jgi:uncharacterized protein (DUF4415 family)
VRERYDFSKGRRGAPLASPRKTRITIMLDDDVLAHFRALAQARGTGYQTLINAALRGSIDAPRTARPDDRPVTLGDLRRILESASKP